MPYCSKIVLLSASLQPEYTFPVGEKAITIALISIDVKHEHGSHYFWDGVIVNKW